MAKEKDKTNAVNEALKFPLSDAFEADLDKLMKENEENATPVIIAFVDLDNFLQVNNSYGHEIGDRVLILTGQYLKKSLPKGASIYRFSGDMFAILFNNGMEKEDVFLLMEKIRAENPVTLPHEEPTSISIGIAAAFEDATRLQELLRKATSALFRAKGTGRNKVALAREEKMVPKTSHYTSDQLASLTKLSKKEGIGEAILLREALDMLLKKYDA